LSIDNAGKKTVTMTFRLDENSVQKLREESEYRQISLNTLVNQILRRFVEWDMYESKLGMIPLAKPMIVEFFQKASHEEIVEMAKRIGKNMVKEIALFMKGRIDVNTFLTWFETRMKTSSIEITHHRLKNNDNKYSSYIIKHDLGENWSLYHKTILESIFNDVLGKHIDNMVISPTMISFVFEDYR
jgi:hypothetical protein